MLLADAGRHGVVQFGGRAGQRRQAQRVQRPRLAVDGDAQVAVRVHLGHFADLAQSLLPPLVIHSNGFIQRTSTRYR